MDDDLESDRFETDASKRDLSNISPKGICKHDENGKDA
jgi:hypothetical protein